MSPYAKLSYAAKHFFPNGSSPHVGTLGRWCREKRIDAIRVGNEWRVTREACVAVIKANNTRVHAASDMAEVERECEELGI